MPALNDTLERKTQGTQSVDLSASHAIQRLGAIEAYTRRQSAAVSETADVIAGVLGDFATAHISASPLASKRKWSKIVATIDSIVMMRGRPEKDQHGALRPADEAYRSAFTFLLRVLEKQELRFEKPGVCTNLNGGIELTWSGDNRRLQVIFPETGSQSPYLYERRGTKVDTSPLSTEALSEALSKFV